MSNSINPYRQTGAAAYTQRSSGAAPAAKPSSPTTPQTESPAPPQEAAPANGLSAQEQQMIDQQFPEKPELSMRLYGRKGAQSVNPGAVGSRLDVQG